MTRLNPHLLNPKYRADIDGLRALAVLSVVAYHAFPNWMPGGFIGVDIFFVISGFLISKIIFEDLCKGGFHFPDFYSRRIRRIFPSLVLVLISSYAIGWAVLFGSEYKHLGKHLAASGGFVSNFVLWSEAGYFDSSAETKPLLHLWSLGIEEQFYIIWPLILWMAWKKQYNLLKITLSIAIISFWLNRNGIDKDSIATFYSPQTRFWELLSGSVLAWLAVYRPKIFAIFNSNENSLKHLGSIISLAGTLILIFGFSQITKDVRFPGNWALVPIAGALLIIAAGPRAWFNRIFLSNRLAVWFGLISFPLYLWHWPLLSFAHIIAIGTPSRAMRVFVVVFSTLLAWATYHFVERPMRFGEHEKQKVFALVVLLLSISSIGYYTFKKDGLGFRTKEQEAFISSFENSFPTWTYITRTNLMHEWRAECDFFNVEKYLKDGLTKSTPRFQLAPTCYQRDSRFEKAVLLWGDSHAQALSPGIRQYLPKNWQILQIASSGCPPDPKINSAIVKTGCDQSNLLAIETIKNTIPNVVIVAQAKNHRIETMTEIAKKLTSFGVKKIVFLGPTPQWNTDLPKIIARRLWDKQQNRTFIGINQDIINSNNKLLEEFHQIEKAKYVDVLSLFCNSDGCLTHTSDNISDSLISWDHSHLTPSASKFLASQLLVKQIVAD